MNNTLDTTQTEVSDTYGIEIRVQLGTLEQLTIESSKITGWSMQGGNWTPNLDPKRKFQIETIVYKFDSQFDVEQIEIRELWGKFFTKGNKKLGRTYEYINLFSLEPKDYNEIVNQIPKELHNYAIEQMKVVKARLINVLDKGVITNA